MTVLPTKTSELQPFLQESACAAFPLMDCPLTTVFPSFPASIPHAWRMLTRAGMSALPPSACIFSYSCSAYPASPYCAYVESIAFHDTMVLLGQPVKYLLCKHHSATLAIRADRSAAHKNI
eukprot:TRINITY_DN2432_c2_g1_i1.p2 TRINITY_DN2432_c2_g1~~TRINITY_DN2432_c2_g1_i1.p2  ORF type:complete len:121 (+),score=4.53 TRINITY_DN2432_c2_g1_i1:892-1254(+)